MSKLRKLTTALAVYCGVFTYHIAAVSAGVFLLGMTPTAAMAAWVFGLIVTLDAHRSLMVFRKGR